MLKPALTYIVSRVDIIRSDALNNGKANMTIPTRSRSAERLVDILQELHLHGVVNRQALMHKFNITERTVYRDLNALSPIVEHSGDGQYRLIRAPQARPDPGDIHRLLPTLEKAIKNRQVCQILYKDKSRLINPYKLINKNNICYLQATDNNILKSFCLGLIQWLDIRSETFSADKDTLELLEKNLDPWVSEETFAVDIFIPARVAHYFKRRDLLPGQEILTDDDQGVTLRCHAAHENQILPLLFYWLPNIQVQEPAWLKQKFVATLENYLASDLAVAK